MGLKHVTIAGRLVKDPELKQTRSGTDVCSFTVAVDGNDKPGPDGKKTSEFFRVSAFGKRGQTITQYCKKGDEIFITGDLKLDRWQANDGSTHAQLSIVMESFYFGRKAGNPQQNKTPSPVESLDYMESIY